jgi:hypothetical protein
MKRHTRSILEEIATCAPGSARKNIVESKGLHILESAINFIKEMYDVYPKEQAHDLHRKFINSVRDLEHKKFYNSLKRKDEV